MAKRRPAEELARPINLEIPAFVERVFAPTRRNLESAWDAVESVDDPASAWESLATRGLLPMDWLVDARRQVLDGARCRRCGEGAQIVGHATDCPLASEPATIEAAVTLACDSDGVATVEALALEAFHRSTADPAPARIVWCVLPGPVPRTMVDERPGRMLRKRVPAPIQAYTKHLNYALADALARRAGSAGRALTNRYSRYTPRNSAEERAVAVADAAAEDVERALAWEQYPREKRPNPYAPLREIWELGYKLEGFFDDQVLLVAVAAPSRSAIA